LRLIGAATTIPPADFVGYVEAPDEQSAIKRAIEEYGITEPWKQSRLVAQRTGH
jgi:hypothetical protein